MGFEAVRAALEELLVSEGSCSFPLCYAQPSLQGALPSPDLPRVACASSNKGLSRSLILCSITESIHLRVMHQNPQVLPTPGDCAPWVENLAESHLVATSSARSAGMSAQRGLAWAVGKSSRNVDLKILLTNSFFFFPCKGKPEMPRPCCIGYCGWGEQNLQGRSSL